MSILSWRVYDNDKWDHPEIMTKSTASIYLPLKIRALQMQHWLSLSASQAGLENRPPQNDDNNPVLLGLSPNMGGDENNCRYKKKDAISSGPNKIIKKLTQYIKGSQTPFVAKN